MAVSPDLPENLRATIEKHALTFELLSDADMDAARELGVAFQLDAATLEAYRGYGIDLEAASGRDHHLLPLPTVLVLDADGVIRFAYINPDHTVRLPSEVLVAMAKTAGRAQGG